MKKYLVFSLVIFLMWFSEGFVQKAEAQVSKERRIERVKERRANRRVARRVHRRVARRAHLRYSQLPKYRAVVAVVPTGAAIVKTGTVNYYYSDGIFYQSQSSKYVVVRPISGVRIKALPAAHRKIMLNNTTYYYYYGAFYKEADQGFTVVDAPKGALVDALPEGYEVKEIDGTEYYVLDGVYYQEVETDELEDGIGYEVVEV